MSLNHADGGDAPSPKTILRTADQYHIWQARTSVACWAVSRIDIFTIKDTDCTKASKEFLESKAESKHQMDWVGKCWNIITLSLHDELFLKLVHIPHGHIASLIKEVQAALLVNMAEDVQPLRVELYSASMASHCGSDHRY